MNPRMDDGWLVVDCDAASTEIVHLAVNDSDWLPAFRDTVDGVRVAKIRPPELPARTPLAVRMRIGTAVTEARPVRPGA